MGREPLWSGREPLYVGREPLTQAERLVKIFCMGREPFFSGREPYFLVWAESPNSGREPG